MSLCCSIGRSDRREAAKSGGHATYPTQQAGSRGERTVPCLVVRRKAVHLQQRAHEDHWQPKEHRHSITPPSLSDRNHGSMASAGETAPPSATAHWNAPKSLTT